MDITADSRIVKQNPVRLVSDPSHNDIELQTPIFAAD
jgi:hypothetical protein